MSLTPPDTAGGSIKPHALPPEGFNPRTASPRELRRYGLPERPDPVRRPKLAALWDEIFARKLTYITPTFRPMQELLPGIERLRGPGKDMVTVTHSTWSGAVVHATGNQNFAWVVGRWNVPDVMPAAPGQGSWTCIAWIGIDGTSDVTQIGTLQSVSADANGNVSKNCYAFFEWWPLSWQAVTNFPVTFGDTVIGLICLQSTTEAWFSLINVTSGVHAAATFTAPAGTVSLENQAEWILERPAFNGVSAQLPKFGDIYFDSAMGGHGLDFLADAGTDTIINMVVNDATVDTTTVETPTLIKITYTGN